MILHFMFIIYFITLLKRISQPFPSELCMTAAVVAVVTQQV